MTRTVIVPILTLVAGCDIVGLGSEGTVVQGSVREDGRPVPGVEVALLGHDFYGNTDSYAVGITDSRGRYTIPATWDEDRNGWTECGFTGVDVEATTKTAMRLTAFADTRMPVACGFHNVRHFEFTTDLWYLGVELGPDTLMVDAGSQLYLSGQFVRSRTSAENAVHRDSIDWVWNGAPHWRWEVTTTDSARFVNRTWDGCYTCTRPPWPDFMRLQVSGSGQITALLRIPDTPFADSVLIMVR